MTPTLSTTLRRARAQAADPGEVINSALAFILMDAARGDPERAQYLNGLIQPGQFREGETILAVCNKLAERFDRAIESAERTEREE